jgi:hypothetical protein
VLRRHGLQLHAGIRLDEHKPLAATFAHDNI